MNKFKMACLLSISTGNLMCEDFGEYHEGFSFLMGGVNTGMIARLIPFAKEDIIKQFSWLSDVDDSVINASNYQEIVNRYVALYGDEFEIEPISEDRFQEISAQLK